MKYNININQKVLSETNLDLIDATILDYIYVICNSRNPKITANRIDGYTWIDYTKILSDNPMMRIKSKGALSPRVQKLQDEGFILIKMIARKGVNRMYFDLTEKVDTLFMTTNDLVHDDERPRSRGRTYNNINDNSISDTKKEIYKEKRNENKKEAPKIQDVLSYAKKNDIDKLSAEKFFYYFESKEWRGVRKWQSQLELWIRNSVDYSKRQNNDGLQFKHAKAMENPQKAAEEVFLRDIAAFNAFYRDENSGNRFERNKILKRIERFEKQFPDKASKLRTNNA